MQKLFLILIVFVMFTAHNMGIVATVGRHVISDKDIKEGMDIAKNSLFGKPLSENNLEKLVLDNFIEQNLIINEAEHFGIMLSDKDVLNFIVNTFKVKNIDVFIKKIISNGLNWEKVFMQAKAQLLWRQLVSEVVVPNISVSDAEILEWHEQNANKYGKIYNIKNLFFKNNVFIDTAMYNEKIDCENIELFANSFGLQLGSDISLHFSDMNVEIKKQIITGLPIGRLSNNIGDNEFIVICSVDDIKSLNDEEAYRKLFETKVAVNKAFYLDKIKARYYASKK